LVNGERCRDGIAAREQRAGAVVVLNYRAVPLAAPFVAAGVRCVRRTSTASAKNPPNASMASVARQAGINGGCGVRQALGGT